MLYEPGKQPQRPVFNLYATGRMYINTPARQLLGVGDDGSVQIEIVDEHAGEIVLRGVDAPTTHSLQLHRGNMLCMIGVLSYCGRKRPAAPTPLRYVNKGRRRVSLWLPEDGI